VPRLSVAMTEERWRLSGADGSGRKRGRHSRHAGQAAAGQRLHRYSGMVHAPWLVILSNVAGERCPCIGRRAIRHRGHLRSEVFQRWVNGVDELEWTLRLGETTVLVKGKTPHDGVGVHGRHVCSVYLMQDGRDKGSKRGVVVSERL